MLKMNDKKCHAKVVCTEDLLMFIDKAESLTHTHNAEPDLIETKKYRSSMRRSASSGHNAPTFQTARSSALADVSKNSYNKLTRKENSARNYRRQTNKADQSTFDQRDPSLMDDIPHPLPDEYLNDASNCFADTFVDTTNGKDRILLFATKSQLRFMARAKNMSLDGTFRYRPRCMGRKGKKGKVGQLYVILSTMPNPNHDNEPSTIMTCMAILPDKSKPTYERMAHLIDQKIKNLLKDDDWSPEYTRTDLEKAAIEGLKSVWPNAISQTCWFHHKQAIFRRAVKKHGAEFLKAYGDADSSMRKAIQSLGALAFVPPDRVVEALGLIEQKYNKSAIMTSMCKYMSKTYVKGVNGNAALYPIEQWTCYDRVLSGLARTTNAVEGYNNAWHDRIGRKCLGMKNFLAKIEEACQDATADIERHKAGEPITSVKKKYRAFDRKIYNCVKDLNVNCSSADLIHYVNTLSYSTVMPEETVSDESDLEEEL